MTPRERLALGVVALLCTALPATAQTTGAADTLTLAQVYAEAAQRNPMGEVLSNVVDRRG